MAVECQDRHVLRRRCEEDPNPSVCICASLDVSQSVQSTDDWWQVSNVLQDTSHFPELSAARSSTTNPTPHREVIAKESRQDVAKRASKQATKQMTNTNALTVSGVRSRITTRRLTMASRKLDPCQRVKLVKSHRGELRTLKRWARRLRR